MFRFLKNNEVLKCSLILIAFIIISLFIYYPTLHSLPLWDDWFFIFKSWTLKNVSLWKFWGWGEYGRSWPVFYSFMSIAQKIFKNNFINYHLMSLVLHSANCLLVYIVLKKIKSSYPFLLALLFLVHPVNFFIVTWIVQVKTNLAIFFFLISSFLFLEDHEHPTRLKYWSSVLFFCFSVLAKSVFAPAALLMLFSKNKLKAIPFLLICLYAVVLTTWSIHLKYYVLPQNNIKESVEGNFIKVPSQSSIVPMRPMPGPKIPYDGPFNKISLALKNYSKYTVYAFFPWDNLLVHPTSKITDSFVEFAGSLLIIILTTIAFLRIWYEKNVLGLYGLTFFMISLLPFCGAIFIPIFHYSNFVEYWLSVPMLGLLLFISRTKQSFLIQNVIIVFILIFTTMTFRSAKRNSSAIEMINNSIERSGENDLIKLILAKQYYYEGDYGKSNAVLLNLKKRNLDVEKINREIDINMRAMNGEKIDDHTL